MEQLNQYLHQLLSTSSFELRLEPNRNPYIVNAAGETEVDGSPLAGAQISTMVFPLIPADVKPDLPKLPQIQFVHPHNLGKVTFTVKKTPAGFNVTIRPYTGEVVSNEAALEPEAVQAPASETPTSAQVNIESTLQSPEEPKTPELPPEPAPTIDFDAVRSSHSDTPTDNSETAHVEVPGFEPNSFPAPVQQVPVTPVSDELPLVDRRHTERRGKDQMASARMDALFKQMAELGASDLHLSVSMPPMMRKDGKMQPMPCSESELTQDAMQRLLHSIMPDKNLDEFERRSDTDFAYEIEGLARFRCNIFRDRKGMGGVFRIIPVKMTTAEQLGLSQAVLGLCDLSKGLVIVTGPTGSGKSTTLCAMVNHINMNREDHIITIEDPIEFVHDNIKCLVNQREVHNHTDSFKDALRAALREDPDIVLVGEMRDLETISIAIETAETGHLVFGTLHTTTAASTVDRIIDQFPPDRQQQVRVMLSESLKGVIAQTLLPKIGGGRVAALEILIVTPAISNLIREGKTFQIPSSMQTGKQHGMVVLNDALYDLVQKKIVEPRDAYIKAIDKVNFESMLTRGGFKI
jgi:twitching motility protein PilT